MAQLTYEDKVFWEYATATLLPEDFERAVMASDIDEASLRGCDTFKMRIGYTLQFLNSRPEGLKLNFLRTICTIRNDMAPLVESIYGIDVDFVV